MLKAFISYRREDSAAAADFLYETFQKIFTSRGIFRDVSSIPYGMDFATMLRDTLRQCDVVLVLIGPRWLDMRDEWGRRRLDNPQDFVHEEVAMALRSEALVIPVLLDDTPMPQVAQLPPDLAPLTHLQAATLHADARHMQESEAIITQARQFVRRHPRNWLLQQLSVPLPLMTALVFSLVAFQRRSNVFTFDVTLLWSIVAIFWLGPLLLAAQRRLWQFFRLLAFPFAIYLFIGLDVLVAPSLYLMIIFALALILEWFGLLYFAQNIPRSLSLAARATSASANDAVAISATTTQVPMSSPLWRQILSWGVIALSTACILTALIGGSLLFGRDLNSNDPALAWSYNFENVGTYLGVVAIVGAILALFIDVIHLNIARRRGAWGDFSSSRQEGLTFSMMIGRLILLIVPIVAFRIAEPAFFTSGVADANQYAIDLSLGSIVNAVGALLSLIQFQNNRSAKIR